MRVRGRGRPLSFSRATRAPSRCARRRWGARAAQRTPLRTNPGQGGGMVMTAIDRVELYREGQLPSFDGATAWINSDPLTAAGLRGHVVVVEFWTFTCINWL